MNFYVYVIRFVDGHYYYGYHPTYGNDPQFDNYYGTPVTHKEKWLTTMFWKEILGLYETFEEADAAEQALIRPYYKSDPLCLNQNCGGAVSPELCRVGGQRGGNTNKKSGQAHECGKKYGRIAAESGQLAEARKCVDREKQRESVRKSGKITGKKAVESGQFAECQEAARIATIARLSEKDTDGKSLVAKKMAQASHKVKDKDGKSVLARENGKKAGVLPWWTNGTVERRSWESPGEGFKPGRLKVSQRTKKIESK